MDEAWQEWFAGFCDGEGCFFIKGHGSPGFQIGLHSSDLAVLEEIQRVLGKGSILIRDKPHSAIYGVFGANCLVVADALRGRLKSRKQHEFKVWDEAVTFNANLEGRRNPERRPRMVKYREELLKVREETKNVQASDPR